ncbi:dimethylaniline monooxygenase [Cucurbitaria berberidis CBS 394.84]|uniref:Dimethylaniline monooxygenase n=1 Tax=Cucurbitaria berberidis CBS 394.84 TaxID=1168544 RepID=A0A9P4GMV8_9PLEO|nr:dimethylaniline monooxygenase [Cucurbitaria berberidis CBS 394.84]KAF1847961.1 dimethylaniline monooxygenase [Cucurbitaria berberidis CBS 394.84]
MPSATKRVAVIGAGISGVVAAAHLKKEGLDATYRPCYVGLKNNVGTRLLETTLNKFPTGTEDFVTHDVLKDYIQDTAAKTGVNDITQYDTEVKHVSKEGAKWIVETATLHSDDAGRTSRKSSKTEFDAVVVASGHYHAAKVPNTPGLTDWKRAWPDRVNHSKRYRTPKEYQGKNFLLVGGSVSATDIARELGPIANNIYQSHRNGTFDLSPNLLPENATRVGEILSYDSPSNGTQTGPLAASDAIPATITLKSGEKLCDIHHVILCTGYQITLPFLPHLHSDETPVDAANDELIVTNGSQFHNLHKDIFYINDPTLTFVGVPFFTATFTLFEFQAMVVAKVLSGQAKLPSKEAMRAEYDERVREKGYGKAFHSLRDREADYVKELLAWVNRDIEEIGGKRLDGHTDTWHVAKLEQVQRMKALFAAAPGPEKRLEVTCW